MGAAQGVIFNIQRFSIHDGPGIRTTVFVKGCPLRCIWCHNPESNRIQTEMMHYENLCTACGRCISICTNQLIALREGRLQIRREACAACGRCAVACPNQARELMGQVRSADQVTAEVMKDRHFYKRSGGGVTISGGEPLSQPEFTAEVLRQCKEHGINTCVETCGFAARKAVDQVMEYTDIVLYDIKHLHDPNHKILTGVSNRRILDNLKHIAIDLKKEIWLRMPLIRGVNDACELIRETAEFAVPFKDKISNVYLLPYHELGVSKLEALGRSAEQCREYEPPASESLEMLAEIWKEYNFPVHISG